MDVNLWEPTGLTGVPLNTARALGARPLDIYRMGEDRAKKYMIDKGVSGIMVRIIWNALTKYMKTQPSPPEDEIVSLRTRVSTLENEIAALKRQVQDLQDQRARATIVAPQTRSSSSSSSSVVSVSTPAGGRTPKTFFIWQGSVQNQAQLKNITHIIDNIPALRSWRRIQDVHKASLIFILAFAPGGRADITADTKDPSLFQGANVVGISLAPGIENPVKFPENEVFTTQFNLLLDDSFLAIRSNDHNKNELNALQKLDPNAPMRMDSECAFCLEPGPVSRCGNQCGALYCNQDCANADWTKGHGADCEKIGYSAGRERVLNEVDLLKWDWQDAAPFLSQEQIERLVNNGQGLRPLDLYGSSVDEIINIFASDYAIHLTQWQAERIRRAAIHFRREL